MCEDGECLVGEVARLQYRLEQETEKADRALRELRRSEIRALDPAPSDPSSAETSVTEV